MKIVLVLFNKMKEEYKILKDFPEYLIYNTGKIYSLKTKRFLKLHYDSCGYRHVTLYKGTKSSRVTIKVHILVAKAFISNPLNKREVNHIDCNKSNNVVTNLEWVTKKENIKHALLKGRCNRSRLSPLKEEQVKLVPILIENGFSIKLISRLYKVSSTTVREIITGKTWTYLHLKVDRKKYKTGIIYINNVLFNKLKSFDIDNTVLNSRVKMLESV